MNRINKNKGMYLETIINNSINYYESNNIALFRKQSVPIKIKEVDKKKVIGFLENKADSDYYGIHCGKFIAIEAKQTKFAYFNYNLIRKHQIRFLNKINFFGGDSYLIIYFSKTEKFYCLKFSILQDFVITHKTKRIYENWFNQNEFSVELYFPGWIDFIKKIKTE